MEIWKDIEGYEGIYQVSNLGRVKSLERIIVCKNNVKKFYSEKFLKPVSDNQGYQIIHLNSKIHKSKNHKIHRLVAFAFIPIINGKIEINHIDGNKKNNEINNIEWCTSSENKKHAFKLGLRNNKGENGSHKIKEKQAIEIKYQNKGKTLKCIAKKYNVSIALISKIKNNKVWTHI